MYAATGGPKGPEDVNSRYIYEDVPKGLVLLETLAKIANIPTPLATSLIEISSFLLSRNFRKDNQEELSSFINSISNKNIFNKLVG